jgi:hypothetical protein
MEEIKRGWCLVTPDFGCRCDDGMMWFCCFVFSSRSILSMRNAIWMLGNYASSVFYLCCFLFPRTPVIIIYVCFHTRNPTKESTVTIMFVIHAPIVLILPLHCSTNASPCFSLSPSLLPIYPLLSRCTVCKPDNHPRNTT